MLSLMSPNERNQQTTWYEWDKMFKLLLVLLGRGWGAGTSGLGVGVLRASCLQVHAPAHDYMSFGSLSLAVKSPENTL